MVLFAGNNITSDDTAPGEGSFIDQTATNYFVSLVPGSEDCHLKDATEAGAAGINLSSDFTIDIDGDTRPAEPTAWAIGADQR